MPKIAKKKGFILFFEKKCSKNLPVSKMAVILQRFSTEISSSGLGRRPLTAETRVRVPVSLPSKAFSIRAGGFLVYGLGKCLCRPSRPRSLVPFGRFPVPRPPFSGSPWPVPCAATLLRPPSVTPSCRCKPPVARRLLWCRRCTTLHRPALAGAAAVAGLSSENCVWRH